MNLTNIKIKGYKSIEELDIPIIKRNGSYTTIFLGKNETGKSNILDAISSLISLKNGENIDFFSIRNQKNEPQRISTFFYIEPEYHEHDEYRKFISNRIKISNEILSKIIVEKAHKEIYITNGDTKFKSLWTFEIKKLELRHMSFSKEIKQIPAQIIGGVTKPARTETNITIESDYNITLSQDTLLTHDKLIELLSPILSEYFEKKEIQVSIWKPNEKYLIQDKIALKDFANNPQNYPPLRNIFALTGLITKEQITEKIIEIEKLSNSRRKLEKKLSENTTNYINNKWPEHKISIDVDITDELNIYVKVQDKDNTDSFYKMSERSQGFKQFISLLLSISINHQSGTIKNNLILIDEPEVHLHPSGIRYMLKELLEIGENNYLFIATHSNFMLDRKIKDRHFLLTKTCGITSFKQISSDSDINDDEVLKTAFGINFIRDFISDYKLLVEGATDKVLLTKVFKQIVPQNKILITNGGGDNLRAIASLAAYYEIYPLVIVDDDESGKQIKKDILKVKGNFTTDTVCTIRDIHGAIKDQGTIEDTLPIVYIENKINATLTIENIKNIILQENKPFCEQLKIHLQKEICETTMSKKEKSDKIDSIIDKIKTNISDDYNEKTIETKAPLLWNLANKILLKIGIDSKS